MEFMEPKDIDWSRVVSRYVRDETYEGIEAPHWADLTDPNAGRADVDDKAWFCRPGTLSLPSRSLAGSPLAGGRAGGAPVASWLAPLDLTARRSNQSSAR